MSEKFILTKGMHLGHCKDTFGRGSVIEHDEQHGLLIIDGRKFSDTRDIDILKRYSARNPDRPWLIPYSAQALAAIRGVVTPPVAAQVKPRPGVNMPIVQSDEDNHPDIDIRHTQISKINQQKKEDARAATKGRDANSKLEVIRGDESVEERIASLKGKTDISSMAERVALKRQRAQMQVVADDGSHGAGVGKGSISMNAGQALPSREQAEAAKEIAAQKAAAYRAEVEAKRRSSGVEVPGEIDQDTSVLSGADFESPADAATGIAADATMVETEAGDGAEDKEPGILSTIELENTSLKAENETLKATQEAILKRLAALETASPPKRAPGRPKKIPPAAGSTGASVVGG